MFQKLLDRALGRLVVRGCLTVHHADGTTRTYGAPPGPRAAIRIHGTDAVRRLVLNPALAFGELYMDGDIEPEGCSIGEVLEVLVLNQRQGGRRQRHSRERLWSERGWSGRQLLDAHHQHRCHRYRNECLRPEDKGRRHREWCNFERCERNRCRNEQRRQC